MIKNLIYVFKVIFSLILLSFFFFISGIQFMIFLAKLRKMGIRYNTKDLIRFANDYNQAIPIEILQRLKQQEKKE